MSILHLAHWAGEHLELIGLLAAPTLGWGVVLTEPRTAADVTRPEVDRG